MSATEVGFHLQQERKKKGISFEQAVGDLRISKLYLKAIEEGNKTVIPSGGYYAAYIASYAEYLQLDKDTVLQCLEHQPPQPDAFDHVPVMEKDNAYRPSKWQLVLSLALTIVFYVIMRHY